MNSRQLQYAVLLSQVLNISQAADKLNITQPALSKQILSLEKELGVTLFDRSTTPLTMTPAGENFVRDAKEILFKEEKLKRSMEDFKNGEKGRLIIGISPFRATYFLSDIIMQLQSKYPHLQIILNETNSTQLQKETIEGQVDFSILNLPVDEALLDVFPLAPEPVVLVIPKRFSDRLTTNKMQPDTSYPVIDLSECNGIPFIALGKTQELRLLFDKMCMTGGLAPDISTEVVGITTAYNLAHSGIGATVLPLRFIEGHNSDNNLSVFSLKNTACIRQPAIIIPKGQHISKYARDAIELITNR